MQPAQSNTTEQTGKWVSAKVYATFFGLSQDTLGNWRWRDRRAGRSEAVPGFPVYRRFGRAVRYWLPSQNAPSGIEILSTQHGR